MSPKIDFYDYMRYNGEFFLSGSRLIRHPYGKKMYVLLAASNKPEN